MWSGLNWLSWGPVEYFCWYCNEPVRFVILIAIIEYHYLLNVTPCSKDEHPNVGTLVPDYMASSWTSINGWKFIGQVRDHRFLGKCTILLSYVVSANVVGPWSRVMIASSTADWDSPTEETAGIPRGWCCVPTNLAGLPRPRGNDATDMCPTGNNSHFWQKCFRPLSLCGCQASALNRRRLGSRLLEYVRDLLRRNIRVRSRSNAGIVCSNLTQDMDACVCFYCV
jgi:hypothetical protein